MKVSEKDFLKTVIELGHLFGWRIAHFRTSQNSKGQYFTAVQGDGAGFVDLVLVNPTQHRILYVELKSEKGKLSDAQEQWKLDIINSGGKYYLWRPSDFDEIYAILT